MEKPFGTEFSKELTHVEVIVIGDCDPFREYEDFRCLRSCKPSSAASEAAERKILRSISKSTKSVHFLVILSHQETTSTANEWILY